MAEIPANYGARFMHKQMPGLQQTLPPASLDLVREPEHHKYLAAGARPVKKIAQWYESLARAQLAHHTHHGAFARLQDYYCAKHVIKEEDIPKSHFKIRAGQLGAAPGPEWKDEEIATVITQQKQSLSKWLRYLGSDQTSAYPLWAKHWVFDGMLKLGALDREGFKFSKRGKTTVAPFAELDPEAVAKVIRLIDAKAKVDAMPGLSRSTQTADGKKINPKFEEFKKLVPERKVDQELWALVSDANFGKLYAAELKALAAIQQEQAASLEGEWVMYPKASDHMSLVNAIEDHHTGWCTASPTMAEDQLKDGDFYVYFSQDEGGLARIPRIAIRMHGNEVAEVRGVAHDQNLESCCMAIAREKLADLPSGDKYFKKFENVEKFNQVEQKHLTGEPLDKSEIQFIYELKGPIEFFGQSQDRRVAQLLRRRDTRSDMAVNYGYSPEQVALNRDEINDETLVFYDQRGVSSVEEGDDATDHIHVKSGTPEPFLMMARLNNISANPSQELDANDLALIFELDGRPFTEAEGIKVSRLTQLYSQEFTDRNFLADLLELKAHRPDAEAEINEVFEKYYSQMPGYSDHYPKWFAQLSKTPEGTYLLNSDISLDASRLRHSFVRSLFTLQDLKINGSVIVSATDEELHFAEGLYIVGALDAHRCLGLKELPCRMRIDGEAVLANTGIMAIPDDFQASQTLNISNTKIAALPAGLKLESLDITDTPINELPADSSIDQLILDLNLYKALLEKRAGETNPVFDVVETIMVSDELDLSSFGALPLYLPSGSLIVSAASTEQGLDLTECNIARFPGEALYAQSGSIYLSGTNITRLPLDTKVGMDLYLDDTQITDLPENLEVPGDLNLDNCPISELPPGLKVGGDLIITGTKITELPTDLVVKGEIIRE